MICKSSLVYQYGPMSSVTWSLSVEAFFYLGYVALRTRFRGGGPSPLRSIGFAAFAYILLIVYLLTCGAFSADIGRIGEVAFGPTATLANGYQDSLIRWLYYFNPLARVPEFVAGAAAAQIFLSRGPGREPARVLGTKWVTVLLIAAVVATHLVLYVGIAPHNSFIGRIASPLYGPLIALMLYSVVCLPAPLPFLCNPLILALGQASYSIYLLHEALPSLAKRLGLYGLPPTPGWLMWAASLVVLCAVSRVSYLYIEKPARAAIRRFAQ